MDKKIESFLRKVNDEVKGITIVNVSGVRNNTLREEYCIGFVYQNRMYDLFIWKNPNGEYGWSDVPPTREQQQVKERGFL